MTQPLRILPLLLLLALVVPGVVGEGDFVPMDKYNYIAEHCDQNISRVDGEIQIAFDLPCYVNASREFDGVKTIPAPATPSVTYPQEYYDLNANATTEINTINPYLTYDYHPVLAIWHKLNAIQIAIETNNKLVAENNALLRTQKNSKLQCSSIKMYQGDYICMEYAWVGGA